MLHLISLSFPSFYSVPKKKLNKYLLESLGDTLPYQHDTLITQVEDSTSMSAKVDPLGAMQDCELYQGIDYASRALIRLVYSMYSINL